MAFDNNAVTCNLPVTAVRRWSPPTTTMTGRTAARFGWLHTQLGGRTHFFHPRKLMPTLRDFHSISPWCSTWCFKVPFPLRKITGFCGGTSWAWTLCCSNWVQHAADQNRFLLELIGGILYAGAERVVSALHRSDSNFVKVDANQVAPKPPLPPWIVEGDSCVMETDANPYDEIMS